MKKTMTLTALTIASATIANANAGTLQEAGSDLTAQADTIKAKSFGSGPRNVPYMGTMQEHRFPLIGVEAAFSPQDVSHALLRQSAGAISALPRGVREVTRQWIEVMGEQTSLPTIRVIQALCCAQIAPQQLKVNLQSKCRKTGEILGKFSQAQVGSVKALLG